MYDEFECVGVCGECWVECEGECYNALFFLIISEYCCVCYE